MLLVKNEVINISFCSLDFTIMFTSTSGTSHKLWKMLDIFESNFHFLKVFCERNYMKRGSIFDNFFCVDKDFFAVNVFKLLLLKSMYCNGFHNSEKKFSSLIKYQRFWGRPQSIVFLHSWIASCNRIQNQPHCYFQDCPHEHLQYYPHRS